MKHPKRCLCLVALAALVTGPDGAVAQNSAVEPKPRDMCAPPPGMVAPSLPAKLLEGQGRLHLAITTSNPKSQEFFNQGVAQMHSFWSNEAERSFLQAAQLDPQCAMAYWGVAMAASGDYRPAFQLERRNDPPGRESPRKVSPERSSRQASGATGRSGSQRARDAAAKALELAGGVSARERMYIEAVVARRNTQSANSTADYIAALRKLVAAYPDELEAKTFLALATMNGYNNDKSPRPGTVESVALVNEVLKINPDHFGAHHYIIHGLEGSSHPEDAWESCKRYPELVTNIPHALHMPGHIYVQSGRWDNAASSFEAAKRNEEKYLAADALYGYGHHGHNVLFLISTYGFQQRYDDAIRTSRELMGIRETPREAGNKIGSSAYRQGWFGMMRTLVRSEKWDEILAGQMLPDDPRPAEAAWRHWARGLSYAAKREPKPAKNELKAMKKSLKQYRKAGGRVPAQLEAARVELEGQIQAHGNKPTKGVEKMWQAARMEAALEYSEPPIYPRPVLEALGRIAQASGLAEEARRAFQQALVANPGSLVARRGLEARLQAPGSRLQ